MAYPSTIFLAIILVATSTAAHGVIIDGRDVAQINVTGRVLCSISGNPPGTGLSGIRVFVSCNGGQTSIGEGLTDPTGLVSFLVSTADGTVFDRSLCFAIVRLPVATCTVLPPTGSIRSLVTIASFASTAIGVVADLVFGTLLYSPF